MICGQYELDCRLSDKEDKQSNKGLISIDKISSLPRRTFYIGSTAPIIGWRVREGKGRDIKSAGQDKT